MALYKHKYQTTNGTKQSEYWYFRFNRDGKTYTGSTGTSNKTQAAKFEDKKKLEINEAKDEVKVKTLTVKDAFAKYEAAMAHAGELVNISGRIRKLQGWNVDKRTHKPHQVFGFSAERRLDSITMT